MKLFIAPNSAVTFDSAMGYKTNPQLVENQAADFSFAPDLPQNCPNVSTACQRIVVYCKVLEKEYYYVECTRMGRKYQHPNNA